MMKFIHAGLNILAFGFAAASMEAVFDWKDPKYKDSAPKAVFVNVLGVLTAHLEG